MNMIPEEIMASTSVNPAPAFCLLFCPKRAAIQTLVTGHLARH
jgi:hypothetical protein